MTVSEDTQPSLSGLGAKPRPARELAVELIRPLAGLLVALLLRLRIPAPAVVLVHGAIGFGAALALARGELLPAALLLQLKTVLDNADGALARASGRVSLLGRYLDTVVDLAVNAAVFAALGHVTGQQLLALAGFLGVTAVLSVDFNLTELYREAHGDPSELPPASGSPAERALGAVYAVIFTPQDRLVRAIARRRLDTILAAEPDPARVAQAIRAYHDRGTLAVLANLGLSTVLLALGACLVLDVPEAFLWLPVGAAVSLPLLQFRRERLARGALAR